MKLAALALAVCAGLAAQDAIRLVVMADDMGAAHGIDEGTIRAFRDGIVRSTNIIVPGPWLLHAVQELKENPGLDAGVHLALTSEWEFLKWRPLTAVPSLVDENGYFFPTTPAARSRVRLEDAERELRAQIETARRLLPRVGFMTAHMGTATATPELRALTGKLAAEYKMPLLGSLAGVQWLRQIYRGTDSGEEKAAALAARLEELTPGTWATVDHAAIDNEETRAIGHLGYRGVAQDRYANVQCWTSKQVKEVIRRRKIQLVSWGDLLRQQPR